MEYTPVCGVDGKTYGNLCTLETSDTTLDYEGECLIVEPTPEPELTTPEPELTTPEPELTTPEPELTTPEPVELTTEISSMTSHISVPEGVGVPGCEETDECYLPYETTVSVGTTVTWSNDDTAAHTVTSGTTSDGPDGLFDSSIFMSGTNFEFTFDESGTYDYFCIVHPWMTGKVIVAEIKEIPVASESLEVMIQNQN